MPNCPAGSVESIRVPLVSLLSYGQYVNERPAATTVLTLEIAERRTNVYENKGQPWKTYEQSRNVVENTGTYKL